MNSDSVTITVDSSSIKSFISSSEPDPTPAQLEFFSATPSPEPLMTGRDWPDLENSEDEFEFPSSAHLKLNKKVKRTVYGGGKHVKLEKEEGKLSFYEVAGMIIASSIGAGPLLMAHAARLLGGPLLFVISIILISFLNWIAYIVLGVCARYSGARSWLALISAFSPHRFKIHKVGEVLIALLLSFVSIGKGVVGVLVAVDIAEDVVPLFIGDLGNRFNNRITGIIIIVASFILVPLLYPFIRSNLLHRHSAVTSSRLSSTLTLLCYPLALLILGLRLPHLIASTSENPISSHHKFEFEAMGRSVWGGVAILVFSLSSHHNHFRFINILARPLSIAAETASSPSLSKSTGRRNDWGLASFLGVGGTLILQLAFGLTGYLAIPDGGKTGNLLSNPILRKDDGYLLLVRSLILVTLLSSLDESVEIAQIRVRKGFKSIFGASGYSRVDLNGQEIERRVGWKRIWARLLVWSLVGGISVGMEFLGEEEIGLIDVAEVVGLIGVNLTAFILPAITFIALFHLRQPRSIFSTSLALLAADPLLLRKERAIQKKLSGRRISQDFGVFAGLVPFGVIFLVRGWIALVKKEV